MKKVGVLCAFILLSVVTIKSQCIGTGCPGTGGGSTPTTIPATYKANLTQTLANFGASSPINITGCLSAFCFCSFTVYARGAVGNGKISITYKDALSGNSVSIPNLTPGTQGFTSNIGTYSYLINSGNVAPTWSLLNVDADDVFSTSVACFIIN